MAVPRITKEDLSAKINDAATTPVLVDVRLKYPYEHSTVKLPGAVRVAPPLKASHTTTRPSSPPVMMRLP